MRLTSYNQLSQAFGHNTDAFIHSNTALSDDEASDDGGPSFPIRDATPDSIDDDSGSAHGATNGKIAKDEQSDVADEEDEEDGDDDEEVDECVTCNNLYT